MNAMKNKEFEKYFLRYKDFLIRMVMSKTNDYQAGQEICQQVFMKFYIYMDRIPADLVKAWLVTCTRHEITDYLRTAKLREVVLEEIGYETSASSGTGDATPVQTENSCEIHVMNRELLMRLFRQLKEKNPQWYELLYLYHVKGLSYKEISQKLDISDTILRTRMNRARAWIRKNYKDEL